MAGYLLIDGEAHDVALVPAGEGYRRLGGVSPALPAIRDGDRIWVHAGGRAHQLHWRDAASFHQAQSEDGGEDIARAPMPGAVVAVSVAPGDIVAAGQAMMVIESMKLESVIAAPRAGVVAAVHVAVGATFDRDAILVTLEA